HRPESAGVAPGPAARPRNPAPDDAGVHHAKEAPAVRVRIGRWHRNDVGSIGFRRLRINASLRIDVNVGKFALWNRLFVHRADVTFDLECAGPPHVVERLESLRCGLLREAGHRVLENVAVVLIDPELLARLLLRLENLSRAEAPVGIDAPGELDPELVLFPHLAGIDVARVGDLLAEPLFRRAEDWLTEPQPLRIVRLVRVEVVAL